MLEMSIFIVEDDEILAMEMKKMLSKWGYHAVVAHHFDRVLDDFHIYKPHLVLMDINLPFYDGFYWCMKIREISQVPMIYISSRNDDADKIRAILQGGDDYIEKPFHLELLRVKIEGLLRRTYQYKIKDQIRISQDLAFEKARGMLLYKGTPIELTKSETQVMTILCDHQGEIVSRQTLMEALWDTDEFISDNSLTVLVSRLRTKCHDICQQDVIFTKKGQGYYIP